MKPARPPPDLSAVGDPVVRSAVEALNSRDRKRWFRLFADRPRFSDDGTPREFAKWCDDELFGSATAYIISIDRVEKRGLTFYASYHSDKWGDFQTFWKFVVQSGKISGLDVGATSY
ncbi:MAG: hypothetical protein ACRD6W_08330 [Nitrososphaerales archaeon]